MPDHLYGFEADSDTYAPFLKPGDVAIVDRALQPEIGDDVIIEFAAGGYAVGELLEQSAKRLNVQSYASGDSREASMDDVAHYDVIVDIQKPKKHRARRLAT